MSKTINNGRDCLHGNQVGKCDLCDLHVAEQRISALEESERRLREVLTALCKKLPTNDITLSNYHARDELIAARECIATSWIEVK